MGQLTNLYVSQSYQGLLKMTDSTNGLTNTLQTVQTGDGDNSPLQMSLTEVNISGSLTVNGQPISVNTGSLVTKTEFNAYTSSVDLHLDALDIETGSLQNQINQKLNTGSFNSYTGSNDARVNSLIAQTGSYVTETESGSFVTNVAGGPVSFENVITVTKGNGSSSNITINNVNNSVSSSYATNALSASYAPDNSNRDGLITTGSIGGSQSITGSLNVEGTISATSASFTYVNTVYETASVIYSSGSNQLGDASDDTQTLWGTVNLPSGPLVITGSVTSSAGFNGNLTGTASYATNANSASFAPTVIPDWVATTGSNVFKGFQQILNDLEINSSNPVGTFVSMVSTGTTSFLMNSPLTQFQSNGEVLFQNTLNSTGSSDINFRTQNGGKINFNTSNSGSVNITGSLISSGSFNSIGPFNLINSGITFSTSTIDNENTFTPFNILTLKSNNIFLSASLGGGVTINATQTRNTGSILSKGSVEIRSGSLSTISNNTTLNINSYLTSSDAGQSNIIKGWGDNPTTAGAGTNQANYTGSLRITGSNNTVTMPQLRATNYGLGADLQGYISGSDNTIAASNGGIFLNTGSLLFPKTSNNYVGASSFIGMNFTTSSLAGGHPVIQNNTLYAGQITINSNSGSVSAVAGNLINGGTLTSNQNFVTNVRPNIATNILTSLATLNHTSSSINFVGNTVNAQTTINNAISSSITNNNAVVNQNSFLGIGPHAVFLSGSQSSNVGRQVIANIIGGSNIIVSSSFVSSSNANLHSSIIYGTNLNVSASHTAGTTGGSAFFGRFNDTGSLADAQNIVFAVGTGTAAVNRRTGLSIDSGSNTRISGSLNVQGVTNALVVTGSSNITHNIAGQTALTVVAQAITQPGLAVSGTTSLTGDVTISGSNPLRVGTYNNEGVIKTLGGQPWLYRNTDTYNTVIGNIQSLNNGFPSGSEKNLILNGFFSPFGTGSNNVIILGGGDYFVSGSDNIFIGNHNGQTGGTGNVLIGSTSYPSNSTFDSKFELGTNSSQRIFHKQGQDPLQIGDDTEVTGSLTVSNLANSTGSYFVTTDSTGKLSRATPDQALPALFDVGYFYSTTNQSGSANTSGSYTFDNTAAINEITVSGSQIIVPKTAWYNFQFSIQAVQGSGEGNLAVWLKKNGVNVSNTATYVTIPSNHKDVLALNIWEQVTSGSYVELAYQSDSNNTTYQYIAPTGNIPGSPSVIMSVNQIR